jgi:hypothetical protein
MKATSVLFLLVACGGGSTGDEPDAGVAQSDAAIDAPPVEPKPEFTASASFGGMLAIDDAGIRASYKSGGQMLPSFVAVSLTQTGSTTSCGVKVKPAFTSFSTGSTSTRSFKTVLIDLSMSSMFEDGCKWDDAHVLAKLHEQFGIYEIGFAQARFTEDRPWLDVFLDADKTFPNSTANITHAGGGAAYGMAADGTVGNQMVEPLPGTLLPALYDF